MITGFSAAFATAASAADAPNPAAGVAPGAFSDSGGRHVVYTAADGGVWQKNAGTTAAASSLGGRLVSAPSPINAGGTRIVFGEGTDHALWQKTGTGGWTSLGGYLTSKPGAAELSGANYAVYVRGGDGAVWARNHTSSGWGPWHSLGGRLLAGTGPSAAVRDGGFWVLAVGTNRELFLAQAGLSGFRAVGGRTTASPALTDATPAGAVTNRLVGYARGTDNAGWWENLTLAGGWSSLGGFLTSGFGATGVGGTPYGYALGGNGQVYENGMLTPANWSQVTP